MFRLATYDLKALPSPPPSGDAWSRGTPWRTPMGPIGVKQFTPGSLDSEFRAYEFNKWWGKGDPEQGLVRIPPTIYKDGFLLQEWVEDALTWYDHDCPSGNTHDADLAHLNLFDLLASNCDRHGGNYLVTADDQKIIAIDHGLAFDGAYQHYLDPDYNLIPVFQLERLLELTRAETEIRCLPFFNNDIARTVVKWARYAASRLP